MFLLTSLALAQPPAPDDAAAQAFQTRLETLHGVIQTMQDCEFRFRSQEYVGGALTDWSEADVKLRGEDDVYIHFTAGPNATRKLLYRGPDWNGGKFRIDPGKWLPTMNLHPDGRLATRGTRHTVRELPLHKLGTKILKDAVAIRDHATWTPDITDLGIQQVGSRTSACFESRLPKSEDDSLYAYKVEICLDDSTGMPSRLKVWDDEDGAVRLVENYEYLDLKLNIGLTDADFAPESYGL